MKHIPDPEFLAEIERFLAETKMPPTRLGRLANGDPSLVKGLRLGREPRRATVDRVRAVMRVHNSPATVQAGPAE